VAGQAGADVAESIAGVGKVAVGSGATVVGGVSGIAGVDFVGRVAGVEIVRGRRPFDTAMPALVG
jgi:hypothetical protein